MTELRAFLTALYDDVSAAEMAALQHGQLRLARLLEANAVPRDVALPVYHASGVEVTLDVDLVAEETNAGLRMAVGEVAPETVSSVRLTLDLFDLVDAGDLEALDLGGLVQGGVGTVEAAGDPTAQPVTDVRGIGPTYATRLQEHGVETIGDLVELTPEALADAVSGERVDVSTDTVAGWLEAARGLLAVLPAGEGDQPVELVDGIGPTFGRRLRDHGVTTLADLLQWSPDDLAAQVSTEEITLSAQQAAGWLAQAERLLRGEAADDADESTDDADDGSAEGTAPDESDADGPSDEPDGAEGANG